SRSDVERTSPATPSSGTIVRQNVPHQECDRGTAMDACPGQGCSGPWAGCSGHGNGHPGSWMHEGPARVTGRGPRSSGSGAARVDDVDDEHERVPTLDARLRDAAVAVTEVRGDAQQHTRADRLAHEPLVPAADHRTDADREGDRGPTVVGV